MSDRRIVTIGGIPFGGKDTLALIAGPCVVETLEICRRAAEGIRETCGRHGIPVIFKSSYRKDNRSAPENYEGPGMQEGLEILSRIREEFDMPVISDVHTPAQVAEAAEVLDALQIPAYLSQQTELLQTAARTGLPVNVKKGQFIAPEDMLNSVKKIEAAGGNALMLTERGSSFGYRNLVVDFRSLQIMGEHGYPVVFDVTHSVRVYGKPSADPAGGTPEHIPLLARSAVAAGCDALFIETHPEPMEALCDAASQLRLSSLDRLMRQVLAIHHARVEGESF